MEKHDTSEPAERTFTESEVLLLIHACVACPDFYRLISDSGSVPDLVSVGIAAADGGAPELDIDLTRAANEIAKAVADGDIEKANLIPGPRKEELN